MHVSSKKKKKKKSNYVRAINRPHKDACQPKKKKKKVHELSNISVSAPKREKCGANFLKKSEQFVGYSKKKKKNVQMTFHYLFLRIRCCRCYSSIQRAFRSGI